MIAAIEDVSELSVYCFQEPGTSAGEFRELGGNWTVRDRGSALSGFLATLRGKPHHVGQFNFLNFRRQLADSIQQADFLYSSMLYPILSLRKAIGAARLRNSRLKLVWDTHNNDLEVWEGLAGISSRRARPYYNLQSFLIRRGIEWAKEEADAIAVCTEEDYASLAQVLGSQAVKLELIENGVAVDDWLPPSGVARNLSDRRLVAFGSWSKPANYQGLVGFLHDTWPSIHQVDGAILDVVGRAPPPDIARLVANTRGVKAFFDVPDVRPYVWRASAVVVPHQFATGSKLKLFEALASMRPIIASAPSVKGVPARLARHISIAHCNKEWEELALHPPTVKVQRRTDDLRALADWPVMRRKLQNTLSGLLEE